MNSVELEWRVPATLEDVRLRGEMAHLRPGAAQTVGRPDRSCPRISPHVVGAPLRRSMTSAPWNPARDPTFRTLPHRGGAAGRARRGAANGCIEAAEEILAGRWQLLGTLRQDMEDPDWFFDPVTGRRAPQFDYCFKVNHRSEDVTGKRQADLGALAHAPPDGARCRLRSLGRRTLCRARCLSSPLLVGAEPVPLGRALDERNRGRAATDQLGLGAPSARRVGREQPSSSSSNEVARAQIWWHQHYLASFRSRGSSANNHVIAEAAGLLVAALAFDWFAESPRWAEEAARVLEQELREQHVPEWRQSRDGLRLPRLRRRARSRRGSGG